MLSKIRQLPLFGVLIAFTFIIVVVSVVIVANQRKVEQQRFEGEQQRFESRVLRDETIVIELHSSDDPERLTFENALIRIEAGCDQLQKYLELTAANPSIGTFSQIRKKQAQVAQATIAANSNHCSNLYFGEHRAADMLELGMATVYDKRNQLDVTTIEMKAYEFICGPLCGRGDRYFYLPDGTQFLEVNDWIS